MISLTLVGVVIVAIASSGPALPLPAIMLFSRAVLSGRLRIVTGPIVVAALLLRAARQSLRSCQYSHNRPFGAAASTMSPTPYGPAFMVTTGLLAPTFHTTIFSALGDRYAV